MNIVIKEVTTKKELKQFVSFPDRLFKKEPNYIPPLHQEEMDNFSSVKNPAYEYCDTKLWLAYDGKVVIGRVCGIVNHYANEVWQEHKVRFGWFDFIPNMEVCELLINTVADFGRSHGATVMHGPLGFTNMDKECWMIDGFDAHQNISTLFNPPYYVEYLQKLGFIIDCEWQQTKIIIDQPIPEKITRLSNIVSEKYHLRILDVKNRRDIIPYAKQFFHTLNLSFKDIYGFIPLKDDEIELQIHKYFDFVNLDLVKFVVTEQNEVIGFGLGLPDLSSAFRKANGHLFPFGWCHILHALKHYDSVDFLLTGVRPDWQKKGVHAIFHQSMHEFALKHGIKIAYSNPQITTFEAVKVWDHQYTLYEPMCHRAIFSKPIE